MMILIIWLLLQHLPLQPYLLSPSPLPPSPHLPPYEVGIPVSSAEASTNNFPRATGPSLHPSLPNSQKGTVSPPDTYRNT